MCMGRPRTTPEQKRARQRAWYAKNREHLAEYNRQRRLNNPEIDRQHYLRRDKAKKKADDARYRERNREKIRARTRDFGRAAYAANPEKFRAEAKARYWRDPQHSMAISMKWQAKNLPHLAAYTRKRMRENPELFRSYRRKQKAKNPEKWKRLEARRRRRYYERFPERHNARKRAWRKNNPDKCRLEKYRRRTLESSASGTFTMEQLMARFSLYGWRCAYCKTELTMETATVDHRIPLCRGGSNWPANLAPACRSCNSRKSHRTVAEFLTSSTVRRGSYQVAGGHGGQCTNQSTRLSPDAPESVPSL